MIVLDTHIWVWWTTNSARLPKAMRQKLRRTDVLGVPAICCWEVAMLETKQRLAFSQSSRTWIEVALAQPRVVLMALEPAISWLAMNLPGDFHGDPADRMIVATALHHGASLATADALIRSWGQIRLV